MPNECFRRPGDADSEHRLPKTFELNSTSRPGDLAFQLTLSYTIFWLFGPLTLRLQAGSPASGVSLYFNRTTHIEIRYSARQDYLDIAPLVFRIPNRMDTKLVSQATNTGTSGEY